MKTAGHAIAQAEAVGHVAPCRIEPQALKDVDDWLDRYRRFFDESFDRLDVYLKTLQAKESKTKDGNKHRKKESKHETDRRGRKK